MKPGTRTRISREILQRGSAVLALLLIAGLPLACSVEKKDGSGNGTATVAATTAPSVAGTTGGFLGDPVAGKIVYEKYCHFCHGRTGEGDGPVGIAITPHPADFVNDAKRMAKSDKELYDSITDGVHKDIGGEAMHMPRWKEILTEKERKDVLAYIRAFSNKGAAR